MNYAQLKAIDTPDAMHHTLFHLTKDDALAALREAPPEEERSPLDFWLCTALSGFLLAEIKKTRESKSPAECKHPSSRRKDDLCEVCGMMVIDWMKPVEVEG